MGREGLIVQQRLSSLSVVFPAYNEERNVERAVQAASDAMRAHAQAVQIIVVNDGSRDATGEIIDRLVREVPRFVAVHHPVNLGYGAALRSGFAKATGDYVFFTDSDLQFDLDEIRLLTSHISDYDMVVGYRVDRADPWHRRLNAFAWNRLVRLVLGVKVRDIDCAFKLFRRHVLDRMELRSNGAMISTEFLALAKRLGFTLYEVPVSHYPRFHGVQSGANLRVIVKAFRELFRMHVRLRRIDRESERPAFDLDEQTLPVKPR